MRGTFHLEGAPHFFVLPGASVQGSSRSRYRTRGGGYAGRSTPGGRRRGGSGGDTSSPEAKKGSIRSSRLGDGVGLGRPAATVRRVVVVCHGPTVGLGATRRRLVSVRSTLGGLRASPRRQRTLVLDRLAPGGASVGGLLVHLGSAATRGARGRARPRLCVDARSRVRVVLAWQPQRSSRVVAVERRERVERAGPVGR